MQELASLLPLVAIAALFYLLLIRPAQRRQREVRRLQSSLAVGDRVMLTSGIYGVLRSLADEKVGVEVAPGVVLEVARGAVGQRVDGRAAEEEQGDVSDGTTENSTDHSNGER